VSQSEGSEAIESIAEALVRHHVTRELSERLMATATQFANDDPVLALGAAFVTHLQFMPVTEEKTDKPIMLVGPPGAGKTLCVAKLATKATLGKRRVTVISTDLDRAGGMEQLAAFTRLLKLNLVEIEDAHALRDILTVQKDSHVFIDTAGRNPFLEAERQHIQSYIAAAGGEATLTLPMDMDAGVAIDMVQEFRKLGATRLLFTRLDMCRRLGPMLRIAYEAKMPLANFSASGKVTEPLMPLNPVALARLVLPHAEAKSQKSEARRSLP
jgi:flagellar biosynthesis protein FlhF